MIKILFTFAITVLYLPVFCKCDGDQNATRVTVGTVLFSASDLNRECWSSDNVALLTSRMIIRNILPSTDTLKANDDNFVTDIIDYFRLVLETIRKTTNGKAKHIMLVAFTDALGGYMRHLVLPIARYAYYSGKIDYSSVTKLYQLYDEVKNYLRTNGLGWAKPSKKVGKNVHAKALSLQGPPPSTDPCAGIIYYRRRPTPRPSGHHTPQRESSAVYPRKAANQCGMEIPMPFFDSKTRPSAIAVPFKTFGLRNVESRVSAYVLVKFYVAASRCLASRSAVQDDVAKFNVDFYGFILAKVMPHLKDDKFYAAFGGSLRVMESIKQAGYAKKGTNGVYNMMPEAQEPEEEMGPEISPQGKGGKEKPKSNLILYAALATILIWFCLGAIFVCCRIRMQKSKKALSCTSETCPVVVKSSKACNDDTCPAYKQQTSNTTNDRSMATSNKTANVYTVSTKTGISSQKGLQTSTESTKSSTGSVSTEEESEGFDPAAIGVQSVQYYPPSFACHTSMTGKFKIDSSTDDYTSKEESAKRPYVFGYDIQTTSEETSPRETSDGENEMRGDMSK